MLEGACGNRYDGLSNLEVLQKKLKDKLEFKRFLLVLDDMWEDEDKSQWGKMIALLNNCMLKKGIILVTTRNQLVSKMVVASDNIYLRGLDDNVFLSFFSTCIFNDENYGGNWRLRNIGQQIANKLKGNPLAAKTVSALLKENLDERYWMKIRDSEEWKFQKGPNDIMLALRLSYEHMPFHLQRCFSYCAIFPEDYSFTCKELIYQWMAQGYLNVRFEGKRMEDIGSAYFNDLLNRGFFQTKQSRYGLVYYTFHDLIHDLAYMVAFKECLIIYGLKPRQIAPTIRHLSIHNHMLFLNSWTTEESKLEAEIVRALACLEGKNLRTIKLINWRGLPASIFRSISDLLKETIYLRAMDLPLELLHICNFQNFVSLRHLVLSMWNSNTGKTFPIEICKLYHLEVFEIDGECFVDELPNNFSDLINLRIFNVIGENDLHSKIWGVGKLISLQSLNNFNVQRKKGFEIEQLGSLKEIGGSLHISKLENVKSEVEASKARLVEKQKLDALYLTWNRGELENQSVLEGLKPNTNLKVLEIRGYGGGASPTWLDPSLFFLESLTLENCKAWELLPPIGELEFLKQLKLCRLPVREIGPQCYGTRQSMKFQSLEELEIIDMLDLRKWVWSDQLSGSSSLEICLKNLKKLTIRGCPKLVDLPLSGCATSEVLERFPSLGSLEIDDCPLIFQLPPLPYNSLLSSISIEKTKFIKSMCYVEERQDLSLILNHNSRLKVVEVLAFHELSSLRSIEISNISSLESLDLHSFVALEKLIIRECQSLTSLAFGEYLVYLKTLRIISCKALSSMKGLKSWVNLKWLDFRECPGFIAAWDSASKELQKTKPDFSLSLTTISGDTLALLTLPICMQLTSLQHFGLEVSSFTEYREVSMQLLSSVNLVDIRGCKKNLQSFPFDLFPSLNILVITFPHIQSISTNNRAEITEECLKLRNIEEVHIHKSDTLPVGIIFSTELGSNTSLEAILFRLHRLMAGVQIQALSWSYASLATIAGV